MLHYKSIALTLCFLCAFSYSEAAIIFETDFSGADWTDTQEKTDDDCINDNCGIPNGFDSYRDGMSFCSSVGNNNFYMDTGAGHPGSTVNCVDGAGDKCLTFWDEGCSSAFEDSDGNVGVWFDEVYEIYVAFWIRFRSNYSFTDEKQHKLFHLQYATAGQQPWSYFSTAQYNFPLVVGGLYRYSNDLIYNYACRGTVMSDSNARLNIGTPAYSAQFNNDFDGYDIGTPSAVLNDNKWHHVEYRFKVNTSAGGDTYNSDGIIQFWYDGDLQQSITTIPWNKNGTGYGRRGWKFFSIGGNNNLQVSGEQWYAVDNLVLSTTYTGPEYEISGGGGDETAPTVTAFVIPATSESLTVSISTFTASDAVGVTGYCVNESASAPTSGSCSGSGWEGSAQTSYVFSTEGAKTLYAWAKDAAGNISTSLNDSVTIALPDTTDPELSISTSNGQTVSSASFSITGTASDDTAVTAVRCKIGSAPSSASDGTEMSGTETWSGTMTLSPGQQDIYCNAWDEADNYSIETYIGVTYTPIANIGAVTGACTIN